MGSFHLKIGIYLIVVFYLKKLCKPFWIIRSAQGWMIFADYTKTIHHRLFPIKIWICFSFLFNKKRFGVEKFLSQKRTAFLMYIFHKYDSIDMKDKINSTMQKNFIYRTILSNFVQNNIKFVTFFGFLRTLWANSRNIS